MSSDTNKDLKEVELQEIATFKNGKISPNRSESLPYLVYGSNGIIGYSDKFNSEEKTIIIGRVGSYCGSVYFSEHKCWVTDNAIIARSRKNTDPRFLYYLLKRLNLNRYRGGSGQPLLNQEILNSIKTKVPSYEIQKLVGKTLYSFDKKIKINKQMNKTLEAVGQALFKRWFVDFEFPNENGKSYKSSGGEMVDSELGEIPKGWRIGRIKDYSKQVIRGFYTKYVEGSNLINLNQKVNRGTYLDKSNFKYYPEDTRVPKEKFAKRRDILINSLGQGTLGRVHLYWENSNNIVVDQHITIVRTNKEVLSPEYIYFYLTFPVNQNRLENQVTGSTGMLMLNVSKIRDFFILIPNIKVQKNFAKVISTLYFQKFNNAKGAEMLAKIRDLLLPKLMSGEIRVDQDD